MSNLSLEHEMPFDPRPFIDPDVGQAFDLVPDAPGVLAFLNPDGSAMRIFEHTSLRALVRDAYKGYEGRDLVMAERRHASARSRRSVGRRTISPVAI